LKQKLQKRRTIIEGIAINGNRRLRNLQRTPKMVLAELKKGG